MSKGRPHGLDALLFRIRVFGANFRRQPAINRPDVDQDSSGVSLLERLPCFPFIEYFPLLLAFF